LSPHFLGPVLVLLDTKHLVGKYMLMTSLSRTYKAIASQTAKSGYRPDLRAAAVARASAIRRAQLPKKEAPAPKLRGAKAKKAVAEKEE
jgi:hypothetical protein